MLVVMISMDSYPYSLPLQPPPSVHPAMGATAKDSDRQLNSTAVAALDDDEHSSMGLFRSEMMMLMHTAGAADQCIGRGDGSTCIRALAALRGVFRANELRFK